MGSSSGSSNSYLYALPNAGRQARGTRGATEERSGFPVACTPMLAAARAWRAGCPPTPGRPPPRRLPPAPSLTCSSMGSHPLSSRPPRPHQRHSRHPSALPPAAARDRRPRCASLATSGSPTTPAAGDAVPSSYGPGGHGSLLALPRPVSLSPQVPREQGASGQLTLPLSCGPQQKMQETAQKACAVGRQLQWVVQVSR
jgi:hypothetical protein